MWGERGEKIFYLRFLLMFDFHSRNLSDMPQSSVKKKYQPK